MLLCVPDSLVALDLVVVNLGGHKFRGMKSYISVTTTVIKVSKNVIKTTVPKPATCQAV